MSEKGGFAEEKIRLLRKKKIEIRTAVIFVNTNGSFNFKFASKRLETNMLDSTKFERGKKK